jgi:hypothetical protein
MNLYSSNRVLPIFKGKYKFKWEKLVKTVLWIIFAILIKSICQFVLGAEETSIEKLLLGLDCTFYLKYILGGCFMALLPDIWNKLTEFYPKSLSMSFNSGDENSDVEDEAIKKSWKGKEKITDNSDTTTSTVTTNTIETLTNELESLNIHSFLPKDTNEDVKKYYRDSRLLRNVPEDSRDSSQLKGWEVFKFIDISCRIAKFNIPQIQKIEGWVKELQESIKLVKDNEKLFLYFDINNSVGAKALNNLIIRYCEYSKKYMELRLGFVLNTLQLIETQETIRIIESIVKMRDSQFKLNEAIAKMPKIQGSKGDAMAAKVWWDQFLHHRKVFSKELNLAEERTIRFFKGSFYCTLDHSNCKILKKTHSGYTVAKEQFSKEDNYLRKQISIAINNMKITNRTNSK